MNHQKTTGTTEISTDDIRKKLSALTHDMRTPLATCQSFLNVLEMSEYKMSPGELETLALDMQETIEKALARIDQEVTALRELLHL